jgi:hypothetical protein
MGDVELAVVRLHEGDKFLQVLRRKIFPRSPLILLNKIHVIGLYQRSFLRSRRRDAVKNL